MPHPEDELDATPAKRPSHFRKRRSDNTTRVVRAQPVRGSTRAPELTLEQSIRRSPPPPPPLPGMPTDRGALLPVEDDDEAHRLKKIEDRVATIGLAVLVAIMLAIVWTRMTSG